MSDELIQKVRPYLVKVAERYIRRFDKNNSVGVQDLVQEAYQRLMKRWHRYDPTKASAGTFAYILGWQAIATLARQSYLRNERDYGVNTAEKPLDFDHLMAKEALPLSGQGDDETVEEWCLSAYTMAKRVFPEPPRHPKAARKRWTMAQAVTVTLWRWRRSIGIREAVWWLENVRGVREAMGFLGAWPGRDWVQKAELRTLFLGVKKGMVSWAKTRKWKKRG